MRGGFIRTLAMIAFCAVSIHTSGSAEEVQADSEKEELFSEENMQNISKTFGYMIKKSIERSTIPLNMEDVIQGIKDAMAGKEAPLADAEYEMMLGNMQQAAFLDRANKNLEEAKNFLDENKKKKGVVSLEDGLVQYETIQKGTGDAVLSDDMLAVIHYSGKYANGTVFSDSQKMSKEPIEINPDQTIPGIKIGISGMKTGEKRRVFVHPDRGYGLSGQLEPNALLVFEIELVGVKPKPEKTDLDDDQEVEEMLLDDDLGEDAYTGFDEEIERD